MDLDRLQQRGLDQHARAEARRLELAHQLLEPVRVIGEKRAEPSAAIDPDAAVADSRIEITLPDGTSIRIGHNVSLVTLRRVVTVLRG
jgi:hypothetical protein